MIRVQSTTGGHQDDKGGDQMNDLSNHFKFFAGLAELFAARFLRPLWRRYPAHNSDDFDALALFLDGYGFARQGARPDFNHAAVDVVKALRNQGQMLTDQSTPQKAWDMFRSCLQGQRLNPANSPLCPLGTSYERKTGHSSTGGYSILEFLRQIEESNLPPNIVTLSKYSIQEDRVKLCHTKIGEINGIGPKIASLFLRDVATLSAVFPCKDRSLLQPVDVWIQRISSHLFQSELSKEITAGFIVKQAIESDVSPEAVNEGMWYFGSEIAGSEYRMSRALDDLGYGKALLHEHIEAIRQEVLAWEHIHEGNKS